QLDEDQPHLAQLIALNQTLHVTRAYTRSRPLPCLRFADGTEVRLGELLNTLVRGLAVGTAAAPPQAHFPISGIAADESGAGYVDSAEGRAHGDRCPLLTFACVDVRADTWKGLPHGNFRSAEDRLLFEYAASLGVNRTIDDPAWEPSRKQA